MKDTILLNQEWEIKQIEKNSILSKEDIHAYSYSEKSSEGWMAVTTMPAQIHDILIENDRRSDVCRADCRRCGGGFSLRVYLLRDETDEAGRRKRPIQKSS